MTRNDILQTLEQIMKATLGLETQLTEELELVGGAGLDSLDKIELSIEIENTYMIDIDESDLQKLETVKDVIDLILKYKEKS